MSTIVTRAGKGSALTYAEVDDNFTNLNNDKYQAGSTASLNSLTLTAPLPVLSGGTGVTTSTGSGSVVRSTTPTLVAPILGTPTSGNFSTGTFTWPTFNQNTTGSAAKWTTARNLAGNSVDGSANVAFSNKFIVQGTTDAGLSGAQFLGALGTGLVKNTTTTGVLSIAAAATDYVAPSAYASANGLTMSTARLLGRTTALSGAAEEISVAGGLTLSGGVLTGTSGTVTAVSVASANGFAGTSSGGATPALTLTTTITGVLKGNGTAISAATAGTDYSAGTSALATGILKSTTTTGALSIAVAGDFPTLNQNTTGTAAGLSATLVATSGGTGQSTYTLGDTLYSSAANTLSKLAGNTTTTKQFLSQTGTGAVSAAPAWSTVSKTDVGLSNVENTALSTWAGSANITTVGTISSGTWQGGVVGSTYGGTGVNNAGRTLTISANSGTLSFTNAATTLTIASTGSISGTNTGDQTITLSGDVSGSGTGAITTTLATVTAAKGGTGQTSYTIGDILYASGATALSKLADVATGNALISGGVGVAPAWGKIGLTTHVSGTLPIANGGTNSTATPTNGGVGYGNGTAHAYTAAGTAKQVMASNGAAAPTWQTLDMTYLPGAPWKESVRVATTADVGASTFAAGVLTGYDDVVVLNVTTTALSTTATTTSTAGIKPGAVISGNADIPAGTTVASITDTTTFEMSAAAIAGAAAVSTTFTQTIAALAVDGVTLALNDRVLVKNQTSAAQNGIYYLSTLGSTTVPWVLTRVQGGDTSADIATAMVGIDQGTANGGETYRNVFRSNYAINTTAMPWYEVLDNFNTVTVLNKTMSTGSVWNGTAVGAAYGGTGQTTYAVGDLLYASAATTISKLADVATGNVLISGGVGVAPSYGKVGLTTHVSGTLPVANGGTGVTTSTGSTNLVLSNSPTLATPTFTTSATFPLHIGGTGTTSTLILRATSGVGATGADIIFQVGSNGATEAMRVLNSGSVGIGTAANLSTLTVNGSFASKSPSTVNAATYSVAATDGSLRFTTTNCTVTLPTASSFPGRILYLNTITANSVASAASNVIPLGSNTAGTAILAATAGKFAMLQSDGTNWIAMMAN